MKSRAREIGEVIRLWITAILIPLVISYAVSTAPLSRAEWRTLVAAVAGAGLLAVLLAWRSRGWWGLKRSPGARRCVRLSWAGLAACAHTLLIVEVTLGAAVGLFFAVRLMVGFDWTLAALLTPRGVALAYLMLMVLGLCGWGGARVVRRAIEARRWRRYAAPRCERCSYPVEPPMDDNHYTCICPECGDRIPPERSRLARQLRDRRDREGG